MKSNCIDEGGDDLDVTCIGTSKAFRERMHARQSASYTLLLGPISMIGPRRVRFFKDSALPSVGDSPSGGYSEDT